MTYKEAREKLLAMGGNCITFSEYFDEDGKKVSTGVFVHKGGFCGGGSCYEAAFNDLERLISGTESGAPEDADVTA